MGVLRVYGQPFRQVDERSLVAALGIEPALEDEIGSMDAAAAEALIASHWDTFMARP